MHEWHETRYMIEARGEFITGKRHPVRPTGSGGRVFTRWWSRPVRSIPTVARREGGGGPLAELNFIRIYISYNDCLVSLCDA